MLRLTLRLPQLSHFVYVAIKPTKLALWERPRIQAPLLQPGTSLTTGFWTNVQHGDRLSNGSPRKSLNEHGLSIHPPSAESTLHPPVTMWHDSSNLKVAVSTSCFYSWRSSLVTGAPFIRCRPCTWWLTASLPYAGSYACAIVTYNSFQYSQNTHTSPLRGLCRAMTKGAGKGVAPRLHTHTMTPGCLSNFHHQMLWHE